MESILLLECDLLYKSFSSFLLDVLPISGSAMPWMCTAQCSGNTDASISFTRWSRNVKSSAWLRQGLSGERAGLIVFVCVLVRAELRRFSHYICCLLAFQGLGWPKTFYFDCSSPPRLSTRGDQQLLCKGKDPMFSQWSVRCLNCGLGY